MVCSLSWAKLGQEGRKNRALPGFFFVGGKQEFRRAPRHPRSVGRSHTAVGVWAETRMPERRLLHRTCFLYRLHRDNEAPTYAITSHFLFLLPKVERRGGISPPPIFRCGFTICFIGNLSVRFDPRIRWMCLGVLEDSSTMKDCVTPPRQLILIDPAPAAVLAAWAMVA